MMRHQRYIFGIMLTGSLTACAAAQPSQQLLDARSATSTAQAGHAGEYAPADLLEANRLLELAESEKDGSEAEVQYAYLAERSAERAESRGRSVFLAKETSALDTRYNELQETGRLEAEGRLRETRAQLDQVERQMSEKTGNVAELSQKKAELEAEGRRLSSELSSSKSALVVAEEARAAAEGRAAAAIASLSSLANVREESNRTVVTLSGSVLFQTGASELIPLAKDSLQRVASALKELPPERNITIEGHTDSVGASQPNQLLSQSRADSVMSYLAQQGVTAGRMKAVGRGEDSPLASNANAEGRANNRRVELIIDN